MGKRTLNRIRLDDDPFLHPIFGAEDDPEDAGEDDDEEETTRRPKPSDMKRKRERNARRQRDEEDEDEDDEDLDEKDLRLREVSKEAARRRREKNAEKRRADALERELNELKNQGKDEEETRSNELKTLRYENEKMKAQLNKSIVRTAISSGKYNWHDLDEVYQKLDLEDIEIDYETGDVDGLEEQLKYIAKKKPYLLKDASGDDGSSSRGQSGSTGHNPPSGGRSKSRQTSEAAQRDYLTNKYKSLREIVPM